MLNLKNNQNGIILSIHLCVLALLICSSITSGEDDYGNLPPDPNMMSTLSTENVNLPFDPNNYSFLIYDPNGGEDSIEEAMNKLGIPYDRRGPGVPVTETDLATHDILIVGWNWYGNTSGLDADILSEGITGMVILSGHDLDFHTASPYGYREAAETMLIQAIDFVLKSGGTGLITLGCTSAFPYIPDDWGVEASFYGGEDVSEFTEEGMASGVYDGLEPEDMCYWGVSYHDIFNIDANTSFFVPFELNNNSKYITIARLKPSLFNIIKDDNGAGCVYPYNEIDNNWLYYNIHWDANEPDFVTDTNVIITDYLPEQVVDFNWASGSYQHDDVNHIVRWSLGTCPVTQAIPEPITGVFLTIGILFLRRSKIGCLKA